MALVMEILLLLETKMQLPMELALSPPFRKESTVPVGQPPSQVPHHRHLTHRLLVLAQALVLLLILT